MHGSICGLLTLTVAAGLELTAVGQTAAVVQQRVGLAGSTAQTQRLPYTAEFKTTRVQTLADGSTITHELTEVMARDSQGRTYQMSTSSAQSEDQIAHTSVNIEDPVAKTHISWFVPGQRVTVRSHVDPGRGCAPNPVFAAPQGSEERVVKPVREDLGKQAFQGIEAHGNRTTTSFPEGAIGNSEPLVRVDEVWFSITPGLAGINVRQVSDDPRTGRSVRELVKFTQGEPDLTMFQAPEGLETFTEETHGEVRCP